MTCYMRHMLWLFDELGLDDDKRNRKRVDSALREVLPVGDEAQCPEIWAAVKSLSDEDRLELASQVQGALEA